MSFKEGDYCCLVCTKHFEFTILYSFLDIFEKATVGNFHFSSVQIDVAN